MRASRKDPLSEMLAPVASQLASRLARMIVEGVRDELEAAGTLTSIGRADGGGRGGRGNRGGRAGGRASAKRGEMTRWVTDARARRVPTFVIEATGLDTKKQLVAKYGEDAVFEKGKPLPKAGAAK